ncbi:TraR/DksA C4-type zinc finger protein [Candidatus Gottesmanbacteria bacterium]|nr:TraR/DksA C4-type zinc finger protein [Candidatus Gottesmanbacteria bacterium]
MKLSAQALDKIKRQLNEEEKRVSLNLESLKKQDPFSDPDRLIDNAASDAEANEETSHDRVEAIEKQLQFQLEDIQKALGRIKDGKYGICQNCGNMIEEDRLAAKPTALYCMDCEKRLER